MKIILDTNVFISGIYFGGIPYQVLKAWRDGRIRLLISQEIFEEYQRVGEELAVRFSEIDLNSILALLIVKADFIFTPSLSVQVCDDPDDDKFIACAVAGKSQIIVSGDKHLLKISGYRGIEVLKPRQFFDKYLLQQNECPNHNSKD